MKLLGSVPPAGIVEPLRQLHDKVCSMDCRSPVAVVYEDAEGVWRQVLSGLSLLDRRQTVLVARETQALSLAVRWSVGGATLLPASTASLKAAYKAGAVAAQRPIWHADPEVVGSVLEADDAVVVKLVRADLWHAMVGHRRALEALAAVASILDRPALIVTGSSLVLTGVSEDEVVEAWMTLSEHPVWSKDLGLEVIDVESRLTSFAVAEVKRPSGSWTVAELPSGSTIGRWAFADERTPKDATFVREEDGTWLRRLSNGAEVEIPEVAAAEDLVNHDGPVVRMAGFVVPDLDRPGSPGSVLAGEMVRDCHRLGKRLWFPGVDGASLTTVLRFGQPVIVDGTVVPEAGSGAKP